VQPVVNRLFATSEHGGNLFGLTPLSFEQNDLTTLAKRMALVVPIARFQCGAHFIVESDFDESAHNADTLLYFCHGTYFEIPRIDIKERL
jgi:hypothetical protein